MLETLIMMGVIAWFARTAKSMGKSGFVWGAIGAISYYVPVLVFGRLIFPALVEDQVTSDNVIGLMVLGMASTLAVGIVCCLLARVALLSSEPDPAHDLAAGRTGSPEAISSTDEVHAGEASEYNEEGHDYNAFGVCRNCGAGRVTWPCTS